MKVFMEEKDMWNRQAIKLQGNESMKRNYWSSVIVAVISTAFVGASSSATWKSNGDEVTQKMTEINWEDPQVLGIFLIILGILGIAILIMTAVHLLGYFIPIVFPCD